MKRVILAITAASWLLVGPAMADDETKSAATARRLSLEVTIAEFDPTLWPANARADAARLLTTLRSAEAQEKVFSLAQLQLTALEHQAASVHFGERVAVPSGRTLSAPATARGGFSAAVSNYSRESLGTIVGATCRVDEGGLIVIELTVEQSRLAIDTEVKLDPADPDASAMLKPVTRTVKTAVSAKDGETVVVSGMLHKSGKRLRQEAVLMTAHIEQTPPVKAAAAAAPASQTTFEGGLKRYAEKLIEQYDKNGDGLLSSAEISKFERAPANADRNSDGKVTADELADAYVNAARRRE